MTVAPRTPSGAQLEDGYQSVITLAEAPTIALWEKAVTPPGMEGGEKVDVTTMHNDKVRTYAPRSLKEVTDSSMTCGYDPAVLADILAQINVKQQITVHFPDGSSWTFWGYLKNFLPGSLEEGTHPTAQCTIVTTNTNDAGVESEPEYTAGS